MNTSVIYLPLCIHEDSPTREQLSFILACSVTLKSKVKLLYSNNIEDEYQFELFCNLYKDSRVQYQPSSLYINQIIQ